MGAPRAIGAGVTAPHDLAPHRTTPRVVRCGARSCGAVRGRAVRCGAGRGDGARPRRTGGRRGGRLPWDRPILPARGAACQVRPRPRGRGAGARGSDHHPSTAPRRAGRHQHERITTVEALRLMAVHAHPDDESSKGAATVAPLRPRRATEVTGRQPAPGGSAAASSTRRWPTTGRAARHGGGAPGRDGRGRRRAGRAAPVAGLRRLRPARGRPPAAAAGRLLRPGAAGGGRGAPGGPGALLPPARDDHLRRERRLPPPRPRDVPPRLGGGLRGRRRPGPLPRRRGAVDPPEAVLQHLGARADAGLPRPHDRHGPGVALRGGGWSVATPARTVR